MKEWIRLDPVAQHGTCGCVGLTQPMCTEVDLSYSLTRMENKNEKSVPLARTLIRYKCLLSFSSLNSDLKKKHTSLNP